MLLFNLIYEKNMMKRHIIRTFGQFTFTFAVLVCLLTSCHELMHPHGDDCAMVLHDAGIDIGNMNYADAERKLQKVFEHYDNRQHRMSADLQMMRITMMQGKNKEFYEYRADAEKCLRVLETDEEFMTEKNLKIVHFLMYSYYDLSRAFFRYTRQRDNMREMRKVLMEHRDEWADADTVFSNRLLPHELIKTEGLIALSRAHCRAGDYDMALQVMASAMHKINQHHIKYNKGVSPDDTLNLKEAVSNEIPTEIKWIQDPNVVAIPFWMSIVREELSKVYAAMGDKEASNYNRNVYYDIIDETCQDMEMHQRQETLQKQSQYLNLLIILLVAFSIVVFGSIYVVTKRINVQSKEKRRNLQKCLAICDRMVNGEDVDEDVHALLPFIEEDWRTCVVTDKAVKPYEREMLSLLQTFNGWIVNNTELYESQMEKKEEIEGEIYMEKRRMDDNKRRHIDRSTAISIVQSITPFLDRSIHQVEKGEGYVDRSLLREFVEKINALNDVLGHWVKVRQGSVTLNIENFSLEPLLEILQKGYHSFEKKNINLSIDMVDATVKADKALTLFMMNTLLDNARKYTPEGGEVALKVEQADNYVEVSITDSGKGLSEEDQDKINNTKVYDSSQIGLDSDSDGSIKQNKGFGFGLMNCRGIIEKYRKSGKLFEVCEFGVESQLDKGSRFFFRLPKGVMRTFSIMLLFLLPLAGSAQSVHDYVEGICVANMNAEYEMAVQYADSAIALLNEEYIRQRGNDSILMSLRYLEDKPFDEDKPTKVEEFAELIWYSDSVQMDYQLIIRLRNEVSLAALSLCDEMLYEFNNEAFVRLNKLTTNNPELEEECRLLSNANANKNFVFALSLVIFILALAVYAMLYYRHTIFPVFSMRQLVDFIKRLFTVDESHLQDLFYQSITSIHPVEAIKVNLSDGREFKVGESEMYSSMPMTLDFEDEQHDIGTVYMAYRGSQPSPEEQIIIDFFLKFASIHTFFTSIKVEQQEELIDLLEEQRLTAETEQQRLHVQNMVLDNCLSTIKHETMYYPNRILQLLDAGDVDNLDEIKDVLKYYREVFSLLSENANRQLSRSIVKLQKISLAEIASYTKKSFEKQNKKQMLPLRFEVTGDTNNYVRADIILLQYLLDTLLSVVFEQKSEGKIELNFDNSEGFIKFALADSRINRTDDENALLFYADSIRYESASDSLFGAQYLIAKQIIRDHDDRLSHVGCRIYAEDNKIVFTLPKIQ